MRLWTRIADVVDRSGGGQTIVPATPHDADLLAQFAYRPNEFIDTRIAYKRSGKRDRWYWAFVDYVATGRGQDRYALHAKLLWYAEKIRAIVEGEHGPVVLLKSTAHMEMDDDEHREYVNLAVNIVFERLLEGVRRKDIIDQINRMVGFAQPL